MFQVVYGEVVVAVEAYEIVAVALVVAEEEVLAVHAAVVFPPSSRLLDGLSLGVVVVGERDVVFSEICEYGFFSCHVFSAKVICISDFPPFRRIFFSSVKCIDRKQRPFYIQSMALQIFKRHVKKENNSVNKLKKRYQKGAAPWYQECSIGILTV